MSIAMPMASLDPLELAPVPVYRFTVEEYLRLVETGFFAEGERNELLEGWIVPKMTMNPPHTVAVGLADDALRAAIPEGWHVRGQSSLRSADSVPEPDLAIVRGARRDYRGRHPGPGDTGLAVEIADSSLATDRKLKARIYARAGIPFYWIINLVDRQIEAFADPTGPAEEPSYRSTNTYRDGDAVPLTLDGRECPAVVVAALLP